MIVKKTGHMDELRGTVTNARALHMPKKALTAREREDLLASNQLLQQLSQGSASHRAIFWKHTDT